MRTIAAAAVAVLALCLSGCSQPLCVIDVTIAVRIQNPVVTVVGKGDDNFHESSTNIYLVRNYGGRSDV